MTTIFAKPTLQAPLTGQALRRSVAARETAEWTACAQALRVAGYRVDAGRLAEQFLRNGCASVLDAFGHEVTVQVRVPRLAATDASDATAADAAPREFRIACWAGSGPFPRTESVRLAGLSVLRPGITTSIGSPS